MNDPARTLDRLVSELSERLDALSREVREYPGPIARCDDQLPALLDRRDVTRDALQAAKALRALLEKLT
jgi:hypothetical protein